MARVCKELLEAPNHASTAHPSCLLPERCAAQLRMYSAPTPQAVPEIIALCSDSWLGSVKRRGEVSHMRLCVDPASAAAAPVAVS
eukprot:365052-Chlamydomonas_euryale.AAC.27